MAIFHLASAIWLVTTFCHLASIGAVLARMRVRSKVVPDSADAPGVTILRPVCGVENFAETTLASSFGLDYPTYEIIFCFAQATDPAIPLVRRLIAANARVPARLLIGDGRINDNPKLNNVAKGWRAATHEWIVMADSNVLMPHDYIQRLFAAWDSDTGLVCAPPLGIQAEGIWAELECAFLNSYQARWQYFADAVGFGFAQGKTMFWRRELLERAGGIAALGKELAEDAAATKLVRSCGLRVRLASDPSRQPLGYRPAGEVWRRQLRWIRLRRDTFKSYFLLEIMTGGVPPLAALTVMAAAADWPIASCIIGFGAFWYGAEALLTLALGWHFSSRSLLTMPLRDLLLPALWVAAWAGNGFVWRGNSMRVSDRPRAA